MIYSKPLNVKQPSGAMADGQLRFAAANLADIKNRRFAPARAHTICGTHPAEYPYRLHFKA